MGDLLDLNMAVEYRASMITSFAQFLEQLQAKEAAILAAEAVKHGPTIGDMYEGLTRELLERAIPEGLNLRLVDGFVLGVNGDYSPQTDAMLVVGSAGHKIPKTEKWAWPIADVLAVFEVKKNLYANDLADSIDKMRKISLQQNALLGSENKQVKLGPSYSAFARVMGRFAGDDELDEFDDVDGEILRTIAHEQLAPVRVVFGYEGYADEYGLREAFADALGKVPGGLAGPAVLPNIIICRKNALLKLNGHPFVAPLLDNGEWPLFGSTQKAPFALLLELLWARLSNQFQAQFPVDDSLEIEAVAPLLTGKVEKVEQSFGWRYFIKTLSKGQLADRHSEEWEPFEISLGEFTVFTMAMSRGGLDLDDNALMEAADHHQMDLKSFADRLTKARLFSWRSDSVAEPITHTIHQVFTPDGRVWLSSNSDLLTLWTTQKYAKK
jgi:hypothetical protein